MENRKKGTMGQIIQNKSIGESRNELGLVSPLFWQLSTAAIPKLGTAHWGLDDFLPRVIAFLLSFLPGWTINWF
jgi:hypothetical protein